MGSSASGRDCVSANAMSDRLAEAPRQSSAKEPLAGRPLHGEPSQSQSETLTAALSEGRQRHGQLVDHL